MKMKIKNTEEELRNAGIKPSVQRLKIYDYLVNSLEHPTVDSIYNFLSSEIPTLSKTTVYNTMKLFQDNGLVMVVNIEDNETRFDADTSFHGHFKCTECGKVYDFPLPEVQPEIKELANHTVKESHYYLKGICANCKLNN
jgi:Fur family peroxide stress response transcriptional regulator